MLKRILPRTIQSNHRRSRRLLPLCGCGLSCMLGHQINDPLLRVPSTVPSADSCTGYLFRLPVSSAAQAACSYVGSFLYTLIRVQLQYQPLVQHIRVRTTAALDEVPGHDGVCSDSVVPVPGADAARSTIGAFAPVVVASPTRTRSGGAAPRAPSGGSSPPPGWGTATIRDSNSHMT
jgi:hypothetical protein